MAHDRVFRQALDADLDACMDLYHKLIDLQDTLPSSPKWVRGLYPTRKFLEDQLPNGVFVVEDDGSLVASAVANETFAPGYEKVPWAIDAVKGEALAIHLLATDPACHKQGFARMLMEGIADWARKRGYKTIRLDVIGHNPAACGFYERIGYTYKGVFKLYYLDCGLMDFFLYELAL